MAAGALGKALGDLAGFPTIHGAGWGKNRCDQMCGIVQMSGQRNADADRVLLCFCVLGKVPLVPCHSLAWDGGGNDYD